jgi:hypothetical protein
MGAALCFFVLQFDNNNSKQNKQCAATVMEFKRYRRVARGTTQKTGGCCPMTAFLPFDWLRVTFF